MPKPRKSRPVVVYSVQATSYAPDDDGAIVELVSVADAAAQVASGAAKWVRSAGEEFAIQLCALARADRLPGPDTLRERDIRANADGERWAQRKVSAWGQIQREFMLSLVVSA